MNLGFASRWLVAARLSAVALGFAMSAFVACSPDEDSDDPDGDPADCRLIANRCHPYDDGSNLPHQCHEVGHEGASPKDCTEMKAQCLAACPPRDPDAGTGGSAGSSGGSAGSGSGATSSGGTGAGGQGAAGAGGTAGEASGGSSSSGGSAGQGGTSTGGTNAAGSAGLATGGTGGNGGTGGSGGAGETACATLGRVCHDVGAGFTEECHELGHDGNEPACQAQLAACLAACTDGV